MRDPNRFRVLHAGDTVSREVRADEVSPDDIILEGDMRRLNLLDTVRGVRRLALRVKLVRNIDNLVCVDREICSSTGPRHRMYWVAGNNVLPGDKIIFNEQNVKPYKYAPDELTPKEFEPTIGHNMRTSHARRLAALFEEIFRIRDEENRKE